MIAASLHREICDAARALEENKTALDWLLAKGLRKDAVGWAEIGLARVRLHDGTLGNRDGTREGSGSATTRTSSPLLGGCARAAEWLAGAGRDVARPGGMQRRYFPLGRAGR